MTQHLAVEVVAALQLFNHHILGMFITGFSENRFVERWIEFLTHNAHRGDTKLLEHIDQLLVEALNCGRACASSLRIEPLAGTPEVVDNEEFISVLQVSWIFRSS